MKFRISPGPTKPRSLGGALVALVFIAGCTDPGTGAREAPSPDPSRAAPSTEQLLLVDGTKLERFDVIEGTTSAVARLPAPDITASRATGWVAVVAGTSASADDFLETPTLRLLDTATGAEIDLGLGLSPMWHPSDDRLAYLQPVEPRRCEVETCKGGVTVITVRPGRAPEEVLPPGRWGLLAWAGDHLLVADGRDLARTVVTGPDGRSWLPVRPSEIWDASPDGRWLVTVGADGASFRRAEDGALSGLPIDIDLGAGVLGDGAWAPDSSRIAATVRARGRSKVVVIGPAAPGAREIAGSKGATGAVLWSPSGETVAFPQSIAGGRRLRAGYCRVDGAGPCRGLFSWEQDVVLLRME